MRKFFSRWASTLIYWSFAITAFTGVLLYFHIHAGPTEVLHIWIGFLMIAAFVLHVARNWKPFVGYFRKLPIYGALLVTLAISGMFAYPTLFGTEAQAGGNPVMRTASAITSALADTSLESIAPILKTDVAGLTEDLDTLGISAPDSSATLRSVAEDAGKNVSDVISALFAGSAAPQTGGGAPQNAS